jgi:hypothetical protein
LYPATAVKKKITVKGFPNALTLSAVGTHSLVTCSASGVPSWLHCLWIRGGTFQTDCGGGDAVTFIFQKLDNVQGLEDFSVSGLLGSPGSGFFVNPKNPL